MAQFQDIHIHVILVVKCQDIYHNSDDTVSRYACNSGGKISGYSS
jgi:hypothetical protein